MDDEDMIFVSDKFASRIQETIQAFRKNEELCDFTIHVEDKQFTVHKLLLAACSDYFKAMFIHNSLESQENKVLLQDVSVTAMEAILEFCYTSQICLNIDNVQEILIAASLMQIDEIQNLCVKYIQERVDTPNCLGVLTVADRCNIQDLFQSTLNFCLDKFEFIVEEREFQHLDEFWLAKLISHNQLNVDNEETVFQAVLKWIRWDVDSRISKLDSLMCHVRFSFIDPVKLICDISSNEFIQKSNNCRDLVVEAKDYLLLQNYPDLRAHLAGPRFQPRMSLRRQQRIYAVGGWTNEFRPVASVERYDPFSDVWVEVDPMTRPRCGVGVTILGNSLYAIGGHDGENYLKSAERYDILNETWFTDVKDMNSERTSVGVVTLNGYIYAIGGQIGSESSAYVERYNPATNVWEPCAPLRDKRLGAGVTVLNGLIFVMGGAGQVVLKTVECYDPSKNSWTYVAPMISGRKHLGCTSYNGKIYAVGGRGDSGELDTAECYDLIKDCWEPIPRMSEKRSGIGLAELDGILYAVGGHNGDIRLKLVEAYNPIERKWSPRQSMIQERLGGGLAVHSKLNLSAQPMTLQLC